MGLKFTELHVLKSNPRIALDADTQICEMVKYLEGSIKPNWQVLAPIPSVRILYFEMEEGEGRPSKVEGVQKHLRDISLGKDVTRKPRTKKG